MKKALEEFIGSIDGFPQMAEVRSRLVPIFSYFLEEQGIESPTPKKIEECYALSRLPAPRNISDVMRTSPDFVKRANGGYILSWGGRERVRDLINSAPVQPNLSAIQTNEIFVIHGRDEH